MKSLSKGFDGVIFFNRSDAFLNKPIFFITHNIFFSENRIKKLIPKHYFHYQ